MSPPGTEIPPANECRGMPWPAPAAQIPRGKDLQTDEEVRPCRRHRRRRRKPPNHDRPGQRIYQRLCRAGGTGRRQGGHARPDQAGRADDGTGESVIGTRGLFRKYGQSRFRELGRLRSPAARRQIPLCPGRLFRALCRLRQHALQLFRALGRPGRRGQRDRGTGRDSGRLPGQRAGVFRAESFTNVVVTDSHGHRAGLRAPWWDTFSVTTENTGGTVLDQPTQLFRGMAFGCYWMARS